MLSDMQIDSKWVCMIPLIILDQFDMVKNLHRFTFNKQETGRELFLYGGCSKVALLKYLDVRGVRRSCTRRKNSPFLTAVLAQSVKLIDPNF